MMVETRQKKEQHQPPADAPPPRLKDEFYAKVRAQGAVPQNELDLRATITELESKIDRLRADRDALQAEANILRRMNNVLTAENAQHQAHAAGNHLQHAHRPVGTVQGLL